MLNSLKHTIKMSAALRHGVHAIGILAWEDAAEVQQHIKNTVTALSPQHPLLVDVAEEIGCISWLAHRNRRATELFEYADPFGRELAKYHGEPEKGDRRRQSAVGP